MQLRTFLRVASVVVGLSLLATSVYAQGARYVVVFPGNSIPGNAARVVADAGGNLVKTIPQIGVGIATSNDPYFQSKLTNRGAVQAVGLERFIKLPDAKVAAATEAGPTAGDTYYYAYQWDIRRVKADLAWPVTSGSHDTVVAVIDTGIAWNHPDLAPNVVFAACVSSQATCNPYPSLDGHGTHVAGMIAAAFDGGRAVGVGPNLGLASYNVFEPVPGGAGAYDEAIWVAMIDAAQRGFRVINMSLGSYVIFPAKEAAIWTAWNRVVDWVIRRGVTVVASAGNGAVSLNGPVAHVPSDLPGIIAVGATGIRPDPVYPQLGAEDVLADYSNYGAAVDLVAPGGDTGPEGTPWPYPGAYYLVLSTYVTPDTTCAATASCPIGYAFAGGTSMSTPHVAGAAGLVLDKDPGANPHQVKSILKQTAEPLGKRQQYGQGMVDAAAAVGAQ